MTKKLEVKIQELEAKIDNIFEIIKHVKFSNGTYLCPRCKILHHGVLCLKPESSVFREDIWRKESKKFIEDYAQAKKKFKLKVKRQQNKL